VSQDVPLGPDDVGRRVSVRRQVGERDGRPQLTDVLGVLEAVSEATLVIRRGNGAVVDVPRQDVTAFRRIADTPPVRAARTAEQWTDLELEQVAWTGWPGLEQEHLGGWVLRAANGFTGRANSALPLTDPGVPTEAAIAHVVDFYDARGLHPRFQVPTPLALPLDERLEALGWTVLDPVDVMTADVERVLTGTAPIPDVPPLLVDPAPDAGWLDAYHYRGGALPAHAVAVITAGAGPAFASVRDDTGSVLAIARAAVSQGWAGITAVEVAEHARRRGLGTHVMRELVAWAGRQGARHAYLQVARENTPALGLYGRMGFFAHHGYHYRLAPE